jgi:CBS domain-containing protein
MKERKIRHVLILEQDQLAGIVSLGDVREGLASDKVSTTALQGHTPASNLAIDQFMTRAVHTIRPDATLREAARLMLEHKIGGLPVTEGARLVGIITESDVFRVLIQENPAME